MDLADNRRVLCHASTVLFAHVVLSAGMPLEAASTVVSGRLSRAMPRPARVFVACAVSCVATVLVFWSFSH
ncbi:hypothetical protein SAJA_09110 [Salinisphaera japonica YTM-1]|uniref:Uncharacterized protein n=1 Tax=Salinisphaera japonica YTM-1 TaxID=1209778 RepID=A0A423PPQ0_9GAMM|nr:hypothetical protein SAJA_09110 [Salinisphaera japonica YTM-1]